MRGADSGPWRRLCALPALWTGIFYEDGPLDAAWDLVKDWTAEQRQDLRDQVPKRALNAKIAGRSARDVARDMLRLSRAGLEKRAKTGCKGRSEAAFLDVLDEIVASGRTPAEDLLALYHGSWNEDVTRVYRDFAY
jgi:glutamate--cysteine ligase